MTLPPGIRDAAIADVGRFCEERVPSELRADVRLEHELRGNAVTIVERRRPWREDVGPDWTRSPIAQLRFDPETDAWSLLWRDSRERWVAYDEGAGGKTLPALLDEVDRDRYGCFWG